MRSFANHIAAGMRARGHSVSELTAPVFFGRLLSRTHPASKWLGYVDQYLIFPPLLCLRAAFTHRRSIFVFSDQALGPWYPWVWRKPHIVHCHDLLAYSAAIDQQPYHHLSFSGRLYQRWIHRGFSRARCFLSVSAATQSALEQLLAKRPLLSAVLYNPLPERFQPLPPQQASDTINKTFPQFENRPFLFHIGRNWYKNRLGVLEIVHHLHQSGILIHLVLIGALDSQLQVWLLQHSHLIPYVHVLDKADDDLVVALYNSAAALLYPSHAEGFGWPVLEALACGCPVVTTQHAPMSEVGGNAVAYIPPAPAPPASLETWALHGSEVLQQVLARTPSEQEHYRQLGFAQVKRFPDLSNWLDQLEAFYQQARLFQGAL